MQREEQTLERKSNSEVDGGGQPTRNVRMYEVYVAAFPFLPSAFFLIVGPLLLLFAVYCRTNDLRSRWRVLILGYW